MGYKQDRQWSDLLIPQIKQIVGPYLLEETSFEVDTKQAADLIVLSAKTLTVACRVRRSGYLRYANQFTIRAKRDNGTDTELYKITNGWGDWMFYGHADDNNEIIRWALIDLNHFRAHMIRDRGSIKKGMVANGDGTHFAWFDMTTFPPFPPLLVASSEGELELSI